MADAQYGEGRAFNLHSAGTDLTEGSALAVASSTGAIAVNGITETGSSAGVALMVGGGTPHGSVDSGNPLKIGGLSNSAIPTAVTSGQRVNGWWTVRGALVAATAWSAMGGADGLTPNTVLPLDVDGSTIRMPQVLGSVANGTGYDRMRSIQGVAAGANTDVGIAASGIGPGFSRIPADDSLSAVSVGASADAGGAGTIVFQITGTWVGTLQFEASYDNSTFFVVSAQNVATGQWTTTTTANGNFLVPVAGFYRIRVNMTARTSGTAVIHKIVHSDDSYIGSTGDVAHDAVDSGYPLKLGGYASNAAPTAVSGDGDRVNARFTRTGALSVYMVDQAGAAASLGGGTQYVGDAAATTTPTGTISMALANSAAPGAVSANNDAVALWANLYGVLQVSLRDTNNGVLFGAAQPMTDAMSGPTTTTINNVPNIFNGSQYDRQRSVDGFKTAAASPDVGLLAMTEADRRYTAQTLGTVIGNTTTWDVNGAGEVIMAVGTTTTGTYTFEVTGDGTNWVPATAKDVATDLQVGGTNVTPTIGKHYRVLVAAYRTLRAKTVATLGTSVSLVATLGAKTPTISSMDTGYAPHNIGYATSNYQSASLGVQTTAQIISATTGLKHYITNIRVSAGGTTAGTVAIYSATAATAFTEGTSQTVFFGEFAPSSTTKPGAIMSFNIPWNSGTAGQVIHLTTTGITALHLQIQYYMAA